MKNSREWVFDTKCLNNLLLTLSILHKRNPILYPSTTCIACRREVEDLNHLAGCEIYEIFWKKIELGSAKLALKELTPVYRKQKGKEKEEDLISDFTSSEAALIGSTRSVILENRITCIRGVFYTSNDEDREESITCKRYLHELRREFKRVIWPFRCEVV